MFKVRRGAYPLSLPLMICVLSSAALIAQSADPCNQVSNPDNIAYKIGYQTALERARNPTEFKVSKDLQPISEENEDLIWNDKGEVLMVTLTKASHYSHLKPGQETPARDYLWFSAVPYLQNFCSAYKGDKLNLRLLQLLGMPPSSCDDQIAEFWVNPKYLFRPCPDPEVYDTQCLVEVPLIGQEPKPGRKNPPWFCPGGEPSNQESAAFVKVSDDHLNWMCTWWKSSYNNPELYNNYPWTALGYTFDWGNLEDPRGMSEYVVPPDKPVTFNGLFALEAYCGRK